jgi:hypothetical protein
MAVSSCVTAVTLSPPSIGVPVRFQFTSVVAMAMTVMTAITRTVAGTVYFSKLRMA